MILVNPWAFKLYAEQVFDKQGLLMRCLGSVCAPLGPGELEAVDSGRKEECCRLQSLLPMPLPAFLV